MRSIARIESFCRLSVAPQKARDGGPKEGAVGAQTGERAGWARVDLDREELVGLVLEDEINAGHSVKSRCVPDRANDRLDRRVSQWSMNRCGRVLRRIRTLRKVRFVGGRFAVVVKHGGARAPAANEALQQHLAVSREQLFAGGSQFRFVGRDEDLGA